MSYFGEFASKDDMVREFQLTPADVEGWDVLFALYDAQDYEGEAWVLLRHEGELYTVHGSHCSCMGLEDQWKPEAETVLTLAHKLVSDYIFESWSLDPDPPSVKHLSEAVAGLTTMERARISVWLDQQMVAGDRYNSKRMEALQAAVMGG
jgi:hypothetical protein